MSGEARGEVTGLLAAVRAGETQARDRLVEHVYGEMHDLARALLRRERADHTLGPTALLHEAWTRLLKDDVLGKTENRQHLFGSAARAMRQVLVDYARRWNSAKRGGDRRRIPLANVLLHCEERHVDVEALDEALCELASFHERQSIVVTLRFFGGFTIEEIALQLQVSKSTVESDFRIARAWLRERIAGDGR
jgi:RNA polymerase sigma factor (TIGR02999 family)